MRSFFGSSASRARPSPLPRSCPRPSRSSFLPCSLSRGSAPWPVLSPLSSSRSRRRRTSSGPICRTAIPKPCCSPSRSSSRFSASWRGSASGTPSRPSPRRFRSSSGFSRRGAGSSCAAGRPASPRRPSSSARCPGSYGTCSCRWDPSARIFPCARRRAFTPSPRTRATSSITRFPSSSRRSTPRTALG